MENLENAAEQNENQQETSPETQQQTIEVSEQQMQSFLAKLKAEENLTLAIIAGIFSSLIAAIIWAAVTYLSGYQIGYMAIGVGFLVGFAMRVTGKGISLIFAILGALFSLIGCALGNLLAVLGLVANEEGVGFAEVFSLIDISAIPQIFIEMTLSSPMDFVFYGIAAFIGWSAAKREIKDEDLIEHLNA